MFSSKQHSFTTLSCDITISPQLCKSKIAVYNRIMIHICSKFQKTLQSWGAASPSSHSSGGSGPPLLHHCCQGAPQSICPPNFCNVCYVPDFMSHESVMHACLCQAYMPIAVLFTRGSPRTLGLRLHSPGVPPEVVQML